MTNKAFACMKIDAPPLTQVWDTQDTGAVRFEVMLTRVGAPDQRPIDLYVTNDITTAPPASSMQ